MKKRAMIKMCLWIGLTCIGSGLAAQTYTANNNAHSHNDYLQDQPFHEAYSNHFGSMEIDVFLVDGKLLVAHTPREITQERTIETLYIKPLLEQIKLHQGNVYPDGGKLQFLIDLKTGGETLHALEQLLMPVRHHFDIEKNPHAVRLVISGSGPSPEQFAEYDKIFWFDGRTNLTYDAEQLKRVAFYSAPFRSFSRWKGNDTLPEDDARKIKEYADSIHTLGKKVRLWGCPDTETCWQTFIQLGIDYLNTDNPSGLARFLNEYQPSQSVIEIVTHRDAGHIAPEHTYPAIRKALELGAKWIEIDVRTSKDGVLYDFHDRVLDRTTNGSGSFSDLTSKEIDRLDAGSWFGPEFAGERVPRIADVLDSIQGKAGLYIDIKDADIQQVVSLLREKGFYNKCFFGSSAIAKLRDYPDLPFKIRATTLSELQDLMERCKPLQPSVIEIRSHQMTPEFIAFCRSHGMRIMALETGSTSGYRDAIRSEADMIFLDQPEVFQEILHAF